MTADPPGHTPTSMPRVEHISAESDLSTRTKQMRFLVAELGISRQQAHRLIKAYELDLRDAAAAKAAHAEARRAGGFDDARQVAREAFKAWFSRRGDIIGLRSPVRAADPRWRTVSA